MVPSSQTSPPHISMARGIVLTLQVRELGVDLIVSCFPVYGIPDEASPLCLPVCLRPAVYAILPCALIPVPAPLVYGLLD